MNVTAWEGGHSGRLRPGAWFRGPRDFGVPPLAARVPILSGTAHATAHPVAPDSGNEPFFCYGQEEGARNGLDGAVAAARTPSSHHTRAPPARATKPSVDSDLTRLPGLHCDGGHHSVAPRCITGARSATTCTAIGANRSCPRTGLWGAVSAATMLSICHKDSLKQSHCHALGIGEGMSTRGESAPPARQPPAPRPPPPPA